LQTYIFSQEYDFYYLTGHNEEGAGLIILPAKNNSASDGPSEILFLPPKNPDEEKWNGVRKISFRSRHRRLSPASPPFKPFSDMRSVVEHLAKSYSAFYTILPYRQELGRLPSRKAVHRLARPRCPASKLKDIRAQIETERQIKSPGEIAFLQKAIDLSLDSHIAAMKMMRPRPLRISGRRKKWSKSTPWVPSSSGAAFGSAAAVGSGRARRWRHRGLACPWTSPSLSAPAAAARLGSGRLRILLVDLLLARTLVEILRHAPARGPARRPGKTGLRSPGSFFLVSRKVEQIAGIEIGPCLPQPPARWRAR